MKLRRRWAIQAFAGDEDFPMRGWLVLGLIVASCVEIGARAHGQASELPSAAPPATANENPEQRGRRLLDEMLTALGGSAWMHRGVVYREGRVARFFHGQPTDAVTRFNEWDRTAEWTNPASVEAVRRVYFTPRFSLIGPETQKHDVVHLWAAEKGYELTYKGKIELPKEQISDYLRRRSHSLEEVMRTWIEQPGAMVVSEGSSTRDRRIVDKVTVLSANNDAVTIEMDQATHLPLQRSFEWRNQQFKDHDVDEETYTDYRLFQGIQTPMNVTRYRDGDIAEQTYYQKVRYGEQVNANLFDPDHIELSGAAGVQKH